MSSNSRNLFFYGALLFLVVTASYLISNPNLLGRIGIILYRYSHIRTFPRALMTVSVVTASSLAIGYLIRYAMIRRYVSRISCMVILAGLDLLCFTWLIRLINSFSGWSYRHTGFAFKIGAFMLPFILIFVFTKRLIEVYGYDSLPVPKNGGISDHKIENIADETNDIHVHH